MTNYQVLKALEFIELMKSKQHTEDCIDANDDTSVFQGKCICSKRGI